MSGGYTLDGSDDDLARLLAIANISEDMTRRGLGRSGLQPGWRALDCGCGPLGALPILAEAVGSGGHVVGVDLNADALGRARAALEALHVHGVQLVCGDVRQLDIDDLGGPFDLIYTRCFLMHQPDPTDTLGHLATLLCPGGWVVAHEPMRVTEPASHPHSTALGASWTLLHTVLAQSGVPDHAVEGLPQGAGLVGLDVVHAGSTSTLMTADQGFGLHAATLSALRGRALQLGVDIDPIDTLIDELEAARAGDYDWVSTPLYLDIALQRRTSAPAVV